MSTEHAENNPTTGSTNGPATNGPSAPTPANVDALAASVADLERLGVESDAVRRAKRIVPWIASVAAHAGLVALGFVLTWTVAALSGDEEPALVVADFDDLTWEPVAMTAAEVAPQVETAAQDRLPVEEPLDALLDRLDREAEKPTLVGATANPPARFAPDPTRATASFVGLTSSNARRIVYVIDASGSMIRSLPVVIDELERSLSGLSRPQEFGVIFFSANEAIVVPPGDRLIPATRAEILRALEWIDENVIPAGRSNPIEAMRAALRLRPDVIFLLSENITGSGEFEIDQRDLLALLDELNPVVSDTGRRATRINCVQFLDPDPLDTLRRIAEAHGGADGYKFLDREELGMRAP